jgi:hypothetical protein
MWNLNFTVADAYAEKRYRYIMQMLTQDEAISHVGESISGMNRELTVTFHRGYEKPENPSLHHLNVVYGEGNLLNPPAPTILDRIFKESIFDV